jgi:hypothetical protein
MWVKYFMLPSAIGFLGLYSDVNPIFIYEIHVVYDVSVCVCV